jgi:hypothetical protein
MRQTSKLYQVHTESKLVLKELYNRAIQLGVFAFHGMSKCFTFHANQESAEYIIGEYSKVCHVVAQEMNKASYNKWYAQTVMAGNSHK